MAREDFVDVQLTAAGAALAGEQTLGISTGRKRFEFTPGKPLNVEKSYEWNCCLANYRHNGDLLVELVPATQDAPKLDAPTADDDEATK
jgi:hypothetical protein